MLVVRLHLVQEVEDLRHHVLKTVGKGEQRGRRKGTDQEGIYLDGKAEESTASKRERMRGRRMEKGEKMRRREENKKRGKTVYLYTVQALFHREINATAWLGVDMGVCYDGKIKDHKEDR
jgi:hypothetical protein